MNLQFLITAVFISSSFVGCLASTPRNVAKGKTAVQSSAHHWWGGNILTPDHAVDGDISPAPSKLASTDNFTANWWRVDLGEQYKIGKLIIFSTTVKYISSLSKVYVLTTNENPPPPPSLMSTNWTIVYYIEPVLSEREEISLYLTTPYQHLAVYREIGDIITREVEVYNWTGDNPQTQTRNLTAVQSSVYHIANASLAVDGETDMMGSWGTHTSTTSDIVGDRWRHYHWWRVSLSEPCTYCYVRLYPYLRPAKFQNGFSRLSSITVSSSSIDSPTIPSFSSSQWNTCYSITAPQNGPIISRCHGQNIKHVAILKNTEEALELVEVEVFHSVEDAFKSTSLTAESSSCVKMAWSIKPNHFISYFKFRCTGKPAHNISSTVGEYTQCGYSRYELVTCKIEAIGFGSKAVKKTTHTQCEAPTKPTGIVVHQEDQTFSANRAKFTISWTKSESNCARVEYSVKLVGASPGTMSGLSNTQTVFWNRTTEAEYTVTVTAKNKPDNIISVSDPYTFYAISRVEDAFNSTSLTAESSSCVKMAWSIKPNHFISYFKFRCTGKPAHNISSTVGAYTQCGYSRYELVTCKIEAIGFGSKALEKTTHTQCEAPTKPTGIVVHQEDQTFSANRTKFTISWTKSESNCARVEYSVKLVGASPGTLSGLSNRQTVFWNRTTGAEYTVTVTAKNKPANIISVSDPYTFYAISREMSTMERQVQLEAEYRMKCQSLSKISLSIIDSYLLEHTQNIRKYCPVCQIDGSPSPLIQCTNDTLIASWNTGINESHQVMSSVIRSKLHSALVGFQTKYPDILDIPIFTTLARTVSPIKDSDGLNLRFVIKTTCADREFQYNKQYDVCERPQQRIS